MSENANESDQAFQELVRLLEKAVQAGADAVGLQWEEQDLMVVHYFGSMGRTEAPIPHNQEQAVIEEIVKRAGLASNPRGLMRLVLRGKDFDVVVDKRDNWGVSDFTLTLKKSRQGAVKPASYAGSSVLESQSTTFHGEELLSGRQKVGRNDPCPCGSGKKYKKCCLNKQQTPPQFPIGTVAYYGPDDKTTTKIVAGVKAYRKHHDSILAYVASIHAGKIPLDKGVHGGYVLLDVLYPEGLTAVIPQDDGSIHFVFESMPCDSTPSLVYYPKTSFDLRQIAPIGGTAIVKGQFLDPHWFYIEADSE